jgi:hypothetical protein
LLLQVEVEFLPWLTQQALVHIEQEALARAVLQQIVADAVAAQVGPCTQGPHACPLCASFLSVHGGCGRVVALAAEEKETVASYCARTSSKQIGCGNIRLSY